MKTLKRLSILFSLGLMIVSCSDDNNDNPVVVLDAGTLSGGPFTFTVDGTPDMVSGISLSGLSGGDAQTYVITNPENKILGVPGDLAALEGVNFDDAGEGQCFIWHMTYSTGLTGLEKDNNISDLVGEYDLSNSIQVTRMANPSANFTVTIENVFEHKDYFANGTTGLILPGEYEEITFNAGVGHYLSFATMFVQSNDLFFAPSAYGVALYDDMGNAVTGDITEKIYLWDAGTEMNEEPGTGANQAPRQAGPNTGMNENGTVELIADVNDGYTYQPVNLTIKVMLSHDGGTQFTLKLMNISDTCDLPTPFAPGSWVINNAEQKPLFAKGEAASEGLERIAEDGDVSVLDPILTEKSGLVSPFAPGAYGINDPVFTTGMAASDAFEALAEDGNPSGYSNVFNTPDGASDPAPIFPMDSYSFEFTAEAGDVLSFATMLVQSNDWVIGAHDIELFENGSAISGDITAWAKIIDSGTEVDEYPGAGANQPVRQSGANTGMDENGMVEMEMDLPAIVPEVSNMVKITITAN